MGRLSIQLFAFLCLITSLAAAPSCEDVDEQQMRICISISRRWYKLWDEIYMKTCASLLPGTVGYESCMQTVSELATEQLTLKQTVEEEDDQISFRSLQARPIKTLEGKNVKMIYLKVKEIDDDKPWYQFW